MPVLIQCPSVTLVCVLTGMRQAVSQMRGLL